MISIPVYEPSLSGNEKKYVMDCLDSNWISSKGKYVSLFEESFSQYIGIKHSLTVCNGTVGLHLALVTLGIGEGDEVIVPTLTYVASVNTIVYTGAIPVFVDSLPDTWQIDPEDVERHITGNTKAIIAVHLYGHPCDMDKLRKIAKEHRLFLIEDCAEAIGSRYMNQHVGTFGDIGVFSFYGNKTITTGEGGMLVTNDQTLYERSLHFRGQGLAKYRQYWHDVIGYNYRMTNICAAIGLAQLEKVEETLEKKHQIASWYKEMLSQTLFEVQPEIGDIVHSYWMVCTLVPEIQQRDFIRDKLLEFGIETRPVFYPIHMMPMYSHRYQRHKVAEDIGWRGINLPSYPNLSYSQVRYICDCLIKIKYNS